MRRIKRGILSVAAAMMAALIVPAIGASPASAHETKVDVGASTSAKVAVHTEFAAQARAAGLTADQANALQGKVDAYLTRLGADATQADFNTIALKGADLHVAVPGQAHPIGIDGTYCAYYYFCVYAGQWQTGDDIHMYDCYPQYIPWSTTGSWVNNQTPGTRPLLTFTDDRTWLMPAAYSEQLSGVNWAPVLKIDPC